MSTKPKRLAFLAAVLTLFMQLLTARSGNAQEVANIRGDESQRTVQTVLNWYHDIVAGQITQAAKYLAADFVDHDPRVAGGRDEFVKYYGNASARPPAAKLWTAFAQGDYVVTVWDRPDKDPQTGTPYRYVTYDVVRLKDGKIQEHWDVAKKNSPW